MRSAVVVCVCIACAVAMSDVVRPPLTNDDVIRLVKAGCGDQIVVQAIDINPHRFDVSPEALSSLRKGGVPEAVIAAMTAKPPRPPQHLKLLEPAVYVRRGDVYALVEGEPVTWKGIPGTAVDGEVSRVTLLGQVDRLTSHLSLTGPAAELLIVAAPGTSAAEYPILRAVEKDESREFRAEAAVHNGNILALTGKPTISAATDANFDLGVRVVLGSLPKGEYGVVAPGVLSGGRVIPQGLIYTFRIE